MIPMLRAIIGLSVRRSLCFGYLNGNTALFCVFDSIG